MTTSRSLVAAVVLLVAFCSAALAQEGRTPKKKSEPVKVESSKAAVKIELPKKVQESFERDYPNAVVTGISETVRKSDKLVKVESIDGDVSRVILYALTGQPVEITESIAVLDLPELVKEAVKTETPNAEISSAKKIISAAPTLYEVVLLAHGEKETALFDSKGNLVKKVDALPSAVARAFQKMFPDAEIVEYRKLTSDGYVKYAVESRDGQIAREVIFSEEGDAVKITETMSPLALPEAVKQALADTYADEKIAVAKKVVTIEYQIGVGDSGKTIVSLDASGNLLGIDDPTASAPPALRAEEVKTADVKTMLLNPLPPPAVTALVAPVAPLDTNTLAGRRSMIASMDSIEAKAKRRVIIINRYHQPTIAWMPPLVRFRTWGWRRGFWW